MTTLIECRQSNSLVVNENGDFTTHLDEPIKLEPEDSISIKSCFIDTKSDDNSLIVIDEDIKMSVKFGYYKVFKDDSLSQFFVGTPLPDGKTYTVMNNTGATHPANCTLYNKITYRRYGKTNQYGGMYIKYDYRDANNNPQSGETWLTSHKKGGNDYQDVSCNFIARTDTITIKNNQDEFVNKGIRGEPVFTGTVVPASGSYLEPVIQVWEPTLPAGKYQPSELAEKLTEIFTVVKDTGTFNPLIPTNNSLLNTADNINDNVVSVALNYISQENDSVLQYKEATDDMYIGTNQFAFVYDTELQKFKMDQMHKPIYSPVDGSVVIKTFEYDDGTTKQYFVNNKSSGVFLLDVQPQDFFIETLGFDLNTQLLSNLEVKQITIEGVGYTVSTPTLTDGINMTGNFLGLDALVQKKDTANATSYVDDIVPEFENFTSLSSVNTPIIAKSPFVNNTNDNQGYFLVEVEEFGTNKIGELSQKNKIKAIVSRYYSVNSYTSGGAETDIPFINISPEPIYINSLHIRILNPDGSSASDVIEDDNTIFFQINKQKLLEPYQPPKNKK